MAVYSLATSMWGSDQAFDDVIAGVAAAGFDQCELAAWMNLEDQLTAGDRRRSLNRHGVSARTVHPQIANVDLSALDDDIRTRSVSIVAAVWNHRPNLEVLRQLFIRLEPIQAGKRMSRRALRPSDVPWTRLLNKPNRSVSGWLVRTFSSRVSLDLYVEWLSFGQS